MAGVERCHWVKDPQIEGGEFMLPGCIGGAVYGMGGCTCDVPQSQYEQAVARAERAESRAERLLQEIGEWRRRLVRMQALNTELREQIAAQKIKRIGKIEVRP